MAGFTNPWTLIFLLIIPAIYYLHRTILQKKKRQAMKFSNISFLKSALGKSKSNRNQTLFYLSLTILASIIIGLANPHIPLTQTKDGVNVILVIDVSGSMQATDYQPTRIEAAKSSAKTLIESLKEKDQVGIITFESGATTASYLTPYKENAIKKLESITVKNGKTAIGDGLALGVDMATSVPNKKSVVILLSDGVNNAGTISPAEAILFAKNNNIQVNSIGLGSTKPVVLGYDWFGRPQYSELDEATLSSIAQETNGKYFKSVNSKTLAEIYQTISKDIKREKEQTNIKDWFFILALILTLIQLYLRYGGKRIIS